MRVLVALENSPVQRFLVILGSDAERDVKGCLSSKNRDKAIMTALTKGEVKARVKDEEVQHANADLILTRNGAHWNLF